MTEITQEFVQSLFEYKEGNLYWKNVKSNRIVKNGDIAGYLNHEYRHVKINSKAYGIHRIIFLYHNGYLPKMIDHIDNNPLNNNIDNLRGVESKQNQWNNKSKKGSSSKYKGVCWDKKLNKWQAQIKINNKQKYLGSFKLEKDAAIIYNNAAIKYFGEYANLNEINLNEDR